MTQVDTSESFEIIGAFVKAYKFQSCKGKLARARAKEKFDLEVSKLRAKCDAKLKEMKKKAKDLGEQVFIIENYIVFTILQLFLGFR